MKKSGRCLEPRQNKGSWLWEEQEKALQAAALPALETKAGSSLRSSRADCQHGHCRGPAGSRRSCSSFPAPPCPVPSPGVRGLGFIPLCSHGWQGAGGGRPRSPQEPPLAAPPGSRLRHGWEWPQGLTPNPPNSAKYFNVHQARHS